MMRRALLMLGVMITTLLLAGEVALAVRLEGGPGADTLIGTGESDLIEGRGGGDTLVGLGGGDWLLGGDGGDTLEGRADGDELWGGPASDHIKGGTGGDFVLADENVFGDGTPSQPGDDLIYGGPGREEVHGQGGDDVIYGGGGNDNADRFSIGGLYGGPGEDVIYGGDGNDLLIGGYDRGKRDLLYCGTGRDEYLADNNDYVSSSCEVRVR